MDWSGLSAGQETSQMDFDPETMSPEVMRQQLEHLQEEKKRFASCQRQFEIRLEFEKKRIKAEGELFEKKWKKLESEMRAIATERDRLNRQKRDFYEMLDNQPEPDAACGAIFFKGVASELALKKRYKDLVKIFHPDNVCGDIHTIQEINREYDNLRKKICAM